MRLFVRINVTQLIMDHVCSLIIHGMPGMTADWTSSRYVVTRVAHRHFLSNARNTNEIQTAFRYSQKIYNIHVIYMYIRAFYLRNAQTLTFA